MKIINIGKQGLRSLIDAPIDEKNVCSDILLDTIYDNWSYVDNGHKSVGFVNNYATMINYGYTMSIYFCHPFPLTDSDYIISEWQRTIVERLTGVFIPPNMDRVRILDEETGLIYCISFNKRQITIAFKYNQKK